MNNSSILASRNKNESFRKDSLQYVRRSPASGTSLFEVLLYLALFSIIFSIASVSYFSIVRHIDKVQTARQRTELHFMLYEVIRSNFDSKGSDYSPKISDFARIIKYYLAFSLENISVQIFHDSRFDIDIATVQYTLNNKIEAFQIYLI